MAAGDAPGVTVVVTPPPTPNGPLHVGHLSGPYVGGDVAIRAARARGERILGVCGLDVHQNYVPAKAAEEDRPVDEVRSDYSAQIRSAFSHARISYDLLLDPARDAAYRDAVAALLGELVEAKAVALQDVPLALCSDCGRTLHHAWVSGRCRVCGEGAAGGACERCGSYAAAVDLVDPTCTVCGGRARVVAAELPVLRMEDYRAQLTEAWARAELSPRVRRLVGSMLSAGLPEVPLAYPTDWGIPTGGADDERIDVWVEMALGYLYAVPRHLGSTARDVPGCVRAWGGVDGLWHFLGFDNTFYYGVLTPALFAAAGIPTGMLRGLVVNEFYRLDGLKFSTSRGHAVWAEDFLAAEDPALVRLFLCWDRPEPYGSDFTEAGYAAFREYAARMLGGQATGLPAELARLGLARAERALRMETFDPAMAARCLLDAVDAEPDGTRPLLASLTGDDLIPGAAPGPPGGDAASGSGPRPGSPGQARVPPARVGETDASAAGSASGTA